MVIGNFVIDKELCNLGANVSLMPLSICEKLKLGEVRPARMSLQLDYRSVKFPVGMLENVPIRIGQFYIPIDFIIKDIKEDSNIPNTLGRPFLATDGAIIDMKKGKLTIEFGEEKVEFILSQFLKAPTIDDSSCFLDIIEECVREMEMKPPKYIEILTIPALHIFEDDEWRKPYVDGSLSECLTLTPYHMPCPKKPFIELKILSKNLRYEFLDIELECPLIVNVNLGQIEIDKLFHVLRKYPATLGYNISNLKGISPYVCMHHIMLEDDCQTSREHQRRVNPILSDVVKREIQKLLEAVIIYPISDSKRVNPVHVVPKKGRVIVVKNEKGEVVTKHVENGWRICIDYIKLNKATRKDHFPLPFIDQMLERLAKHSYFYYLDGYSGFFEIPIHPDDKEKTTFTFP